MVYKYAFGGFLHGGKSRPRQLIGIYHYADPMRRQFFFGDAVETAGHDHKRGLLVHRPEPVAEIQYLRRVSPAAVYHYAVSTHRCVCERPCQRIFHALFKDKALYPCYYHKVIGQLCPLACGYFAGEVLYISLCLADIGTEEAVAFKTALVLDYYRRNSHSFQRAHRVDEMLGQPACIAVEYKRLCGDLHYLIDGAEAAGEVYKFDIGLAARCAVTQAGEPHAVKLVEPPTALYHSALDYQPCKTAVGFHYLDDGCQPDKLSESFASVFGHS